MSIVATILTSFPKNSKASETSATTVWYSQLYESFSLTAAKMKTTCAHPAAKISLAIAFALALLTTPTLAQQSQSADQFFPATTAIYLEVADPPELIDAVMNHPIRGRIEGIEQVQELFKSPQYAMAMMGKAVVEKQLGSSWDEALRDVTSGGLFLGFDIESQGMAVMFKAKDEATLKKAAEVFLNMTTMAAQNEGDKKPFEVKPYRDAKVADFGDFLVARIGSWFLISNNKKLARQIADNVFDGGKSNLAEESWYQTARKDREDDSVWSAVNLEVIRNSGAADELFAGSVDNPAIELLLGGVLDSLKHAAHASANIRIDESVQVNLALPFDSQWASKTREFFYGANLKGRAPTAIQLENTIANFSSYRDFGAWWLAKEDLFSEGVIAQMAEFDSQISTLLAGLDFGEEFLGGLEAETQLIVVEHESEGGKQPDIKLPGFAIVGQLKDKAMTRKVRVAYKNMIGILNLNLGMDGQAQLDATTEKMDGITITSTEYMIEEDAEDGLLLYNFSPSIAFIDKHMVIASTRNLALQVAEQLKSTELPPTTDSNMRLELDGKQLHRILKLNKEPLVANNMVEEGNSRKEAQVQIDGLLLIAELFKSATMDFQVGAEKMNLNIELDFEE